MYLFYDPNTEEAKIIKLEDAKYPKHGEIFYSTTETDANHYWTYNARLNEWGVSQDPEMLNKLKAYVLILS